jgi:hypothetical protein
MKKIFYLLTISALLMAVLTNCNNDVAVTGVKLNENTLTLTVGKTETLFATVLPNDATNKLVIWKSSDINIATVTSSGQITAHTAGETTIEVRTIDGAFTASCKVNVISPKPEDLLTQKNGWRLAAATSIPAYTSFEGITSQNLFDNFFFECELDDILYFNKNKSLVINFGKILCDWDIGQELALGKWQITEDGKILKFRLPYFYDLYEDFAPLEAQILQLDENKLQLIFPISFDDYSKLTKRGFVATKAKGNSVYEFMFIYTKILTIGK